MVCSGLRERRMLSTGSKEQWQYLHPAADKAAGNIARPVNGFEKDPGF